jgi:GPH family glycoside/pentoside/hexuronide:cation symporter
LASNEETDIGPWGEEKGEGMPTYEPIPMHEKIAYGSGTMAQNLSVDSIKNLAGPLFNITLGMSPTLVGHALLLMRVWDAFTDPVMGWISDNTKSRWGRRRPYVLVGAILSAIAYALILRVPQGLEPNGSLFYYFLFASLGLYTCVTILQVANNSLGFEMSHDYHERTNIFAYRTVFGQASKFLIPYLYFFCQLDVFVDTMTGAKYVGVGLGILIFLFALPTAFFTREGHAELAAKQDKIPIGWAITTTLKTRPFQVLVGLLFVTIFGSNFHLALGTYVNIYHVAGGDTKFGAELQGIGGVVGTITAFIAIPLMTWMSVRIGKIRALNISIWCILIGSILKWFTYTPAMPYLQLVVQPFLRIGDMGFWLLITSMKADVCDWDEWKTGFRREGMYGAATGWFQKVTQSVTFALGSGYVLSMIGFDAAKGVMQDPGVVLWMRILFSGLPFILAVGGIFLLKTYPMTEEKAAEISRDLERQRAEAG